MPPSSQTVRAVQAERRPPVGPVRLSKARRIGVSVVALGIWASGAAWLGAHYFLRLNTTFGFETNPAEPWLLATHGAFAFASLFSLGLLWGVHVVNGWAVRRRRMSGGVLLGAVAFLALTGYLLYYAGDDTLRNITSIAHWAVGLAALGLFLGHRFRRRRGPVPISRRP
jgi:MYXO-CTERM domain-containing protein